MKKVFKEMVTRSALLSNDDNGDGAAKHKIFSAKSLGTGKELTDEQLAKINAYARKPMTKDMVSYVPILMAHNGIDRDVERFNEALLADFSKTLPGKGFFVEGHPGGWTGSGGPGEGLHFDSRVDEMTPEKFKELTSEEIKLPEGVPMVHALMSDAYILSLDSNKDTRAKIDAGIIRFASIGFKAPLFSVTDDNGNHLYGEYDSKGEALEGSLVWLGAQPGASVMKGAKGDQPPEEKGAVAYSPTTPAEEGRAWDGAGAKDRLAKWASSDGSGDKDKMDWAKYRKGFGWYDAADAENFGAYKLPHHDVINGEISVIWMGVAAAMAACMGGRGGVDIPETELPAVKTHLEKHYKQFDKEPPKEAQSTQQHDNEITKKGETVHMKILAERLSKELGKAFTAENLGDELLLHLAEVNEKMKSLEAKAADGEAYRDVLVSDAIHYGAMVGEYATNEPIQRKEAEFVKTWPLARIKELRDKYEKMARTMYPDRFTIQGKEQMDRERSMREADKKQRDTGTRRDLSTSQHNELLQ